MMRRTVSLAALVAALLAVCAGSAQAAKYDSNEVIVKYADGVSTAERAGLFDRTGVVKTVGSVRGVGAKVVEVDGDPAAVANRLNRSSLVQYAEPNYVLRTQATPNDPLFSQLYGLHNTGQTGGTGDADIDAPEGWDAAGLATFPATGGAKIGIVDTGIDQTHPDLSGKTVNCADSTGGLLIEGTCVDDNMHGTHVAGTIAAKANNATGVAGVAFNANFAICRALKTAAGTRYIAGADLDITYVDALLTQSLTRSILIGAAVFAAAGDRAFLGGRQPGDRCLYVSTGGFTKEARYEAERSSIPITLITLPELRELLVEHYESLRPLGTSLVPLERLYWPTN
jgi:thermitase